MALDVGSRLAHYDVTALIGEGGMGEVYQATDTKLNREVALKILPEAFAADPDRLARFQREAQVLASLNHPNIAAIYGIEESVDTRALVLELVEGPTLADRITHGAIPLDEALPIAKQIAEALEAAHEQGIIHRDLKPANVKVKDDGTVKVLDFGLAKALDPSPTGDPSQSPTLTAAATQMGVIMGTAAYMSPEQARGKPVDKRADIWAFGVVLLEMLTGRKVFEGEDVSMTLSSVLQQEPNWSHLPAAVSPSLSVFLRRCLVKDPKQRVHDIGDVRLAMEGVFESTGSVPAESTAALHLQVLLRPIPAIISALALVVITGLAVWAVTRSAPAAPDFVTRFSIVLPSGFGRGPHTPIALSPDGTHLVYAANDQLYLRDMDQMEAAPIRGTEGAVEPFFSPDGQSVGFWADGQLKRVSLTGGAAVTIGESVEPFGISWGSDDAILFGSLAGAWRVPASGGTPELIIPVEGEEGGIPGPQLLPGGEWVLFSLFPSQQVMLQSLATGERHVLLEDGGTNARYVPTGHLVYVLDGTLLAQPFDIEQRTLAPGPVPLVEGISQLSQVRGAAAQVAHSDNGSLAYVVDRSVSSDRTLHLVGRDGAVEALAVPPAQYLTPRFSPDGAKLVVQTAEDDGGVLWLYDLAGDTQIQQLTFEGDNQRPVWTPDSRRITFSSDREGTMSLYSMPIDGSGVPERLTTAEDGTFHWPGSWAPDSQTLLFNVERNRVSDWDIWTLSSATLETQSLYDMPNTVYWGAELSANGQWLAYGAGSDLFAVDIYVEPFPPTGSKRKISQNGGYWPLWSPDEDQLFYRPPATEAGITLTLRSVDVVTEPEFAFGNEQIVPIEGFIVVPFYRDYDMTPDGERESSPFLVEPLRGS